MIGLQGIAQAEPVRVTAASSLGPPLTALIGDADVQLTLGGSGQLARQLQHGARADIVALAHPSWMDALRADGLLHEESITSLVSNRLVVVARDDLNLRSLTALATLQRVGVGAESVPLGRYTATAFESVGLREALEPRMVLSHSAQATVAQAAAGAVDAAVIYQSDAQSVPALTPQFIIDPGLHEPIVYPLALTRSGEENPEARALYAHLTSGDARSVFTAYGFEAAPPEARPQPPPPHREVATMAPLWRSIWVAAMAIALSLAPALLLAWLLARRSFRGKALLNTLCLSPLVLPPVVTGWLLLMLFETLHLPFAFTRWAAVAAAAVVGFPLLLILTRAAIEGVDPRYEMMARSLGLGPFNAFRRVTLPMALPGIAAGSVLAFSRALGEFGATAMVAGDQPGETRTLALAIYALVEHPAGEAQAGALVAVSIAVTLVALLVYERLVWRVVGRSGDSA